MKRMAFQSVASGIVALGAASCYAWLLHECAKLPRISEISLAATAERQNTWGLFVAVVLIVFPLTMVWFELCRLADWMFPPRRRKAQRRQP